MVINRIVVLCSIIAWTLIVSGFGSADIKTPEKVEAYKAKLKMQSVEQLNALFDAMFRPNSTNNWTENERSFVSDAKGLATWKKWLTIEELASRRTPKHLDELDRIDKELSKWIYNGECMELRAKIAVSKISLINKSEAEQVAALGKILDSTSRENYFNAQEASRELSRIGSRSARDMLIAKEGKWPIMMRTARLGLEIKNLDLEAAVGHLLDSAYKDLNRPEIEGVAKLVAERVYFQSLINKDANVVLSNVVRRQTQFQGLNKQQSAAGMRYNDFLQELRVSAEKSIKEKELTLTQHMSNPNINTQKQDTISNSPLVTTNVAAVKVVESPSSSHPERKSFTRPEERGEDFSQKSSAALIAILSISKEKVALKKAAKVLGDMSAAGTLRLTEVEKASMTNIVQICLMKELAVDSQEDARELIERLWWTAVPGLLNNIANENLAIREIALKSLSLMRNEEIIRSLMDIAKQSPHEPTRMMAIFALGNMTEKRGSLIPGRLCMDEATSRELAEKQIRPFLNTLLITEKSAEMKALLGRALKSLDEAPDRRLIRVPNK